MLRARALLAVCQRLELRIVDLAGLRARLVFSVPRGGEIYGLDWGLRS
jgi:hypothetical protein